MKITPWETIKAAVAHYWRIRKLKVPKVRRKSFGELAEEIRVINAKMDASFAELHRLNHEIERIQAEARMKGK